MPDTKAAPKRKNAGRKDTNIWTDEERAAVQAAAAERKASAGRTADEERSEGLADLKASLAKMPADDRAMGERIHEVVTAAAPSLVPKTYYGMPAYATEGKNGKKVTYYLTDTAAAKSFHETVCHEPKKVTATGVAKKVDGKHELAVTEIKLEK